MSRSCIFGVAVAAMLLMGFGADRLSAADEPANPPARARGQGLAQGGSALALLRLEVVSKDLNLTDEQTASIKTISADAHKQMSELRDSLKDTPREERQAKMAAAEKEIAKKVDGVLNEKQQARLQEIKLQVRGPSALHEKNVADALKLSKEQRKKLADLGESRRTDIGAAIKDAGDPSAAREKIMQILKDSAGKMDEVLTAEQREQFEKMKGAKLDLGSAAFGSLGGPGRRPTNSDSNPESK